MTIDRRLLLNFDWVSFLLMLTMACLGILTVFSATYRIDAPFSYFCKKQLFGVISGMIIYSICCFSDYRNTEKWCYILYFFSIFLLAITPLIGKNTMGGRRWISVFGIFKFQPSEISKVLFASFFSYSLAEKNFYKIIDFWPILLMLFLNVILVIKQPDLGTGIVILLSGLLLLWLVGIGRKFMITLAIVGMMLTPIGWKTLKTYQQNRITSFLGITQRSEEIYQLEQSKVAIGSGGMFGKGFLKGSQNKLRFLPEGRTDFIFSVFCEEFGFIGAILIFLLLSLLFSRILLFASKIKSFHIKILIIGLASPLIISSLTNIGMVIGLLPIVGVPLPFMTFGVTHLWMSFFSLGIIQSIAMRKFNITNPSHLILD